MQTAWLRRIARPVVVSAGILYRSVVLRNTTFVAITGSSGKTTTKELCAAALATRFRVFKSPGNDNNLYYLSRFIFRVRPSHEYAVIEVGAAHKTLNDLDDSVAIIKPAVTAITNIGLEHYTLFRSREAIAAHKGKLVEALAADGIAVLNADDRHALGTAERCKGRVITYGLSPAAMIRATNVSSRWPDRLSFDVTSGSETVHVQTKLCGTHFVHDVLASLAIAQAAGVPLTEAARAVGHVKPFNARMSPVQMPGGIQFVRDDAKAPFWSVDLALDFLRDARATRRILVAGTLSDCYGAVGRRYQSVADRALQFVDAFIGVGAMSTLFLRARKVRDNQVLRAFPDPDAALQFLQEFLVSGDLVLLKGSPDADDLALIVREWPQHHATVAQTSAAPTEVAPSDSRSQRWIVLGLGNPAEKSANTPHSVGHRAVDTLAKQLGTPWESSDNGEWRADVVLEGRPLTLLKLGTFMNESGSALRKVADAMQVPSERCIIIFDDVNLPVGAVRTRMRGSAGGHRGVESVLLAFQSQAVPRVKIGVGHPPDGNIPEYVLRKFDENQRQAIEEACVDAAERVVLIVSASQSQTASSDRARTSRPRRAPASP